MLRSFAFIAALLGVVSAAAAQSPERGQALNGVLYAVISHLSLGAGGSLSYIRLFNADDTQNTFAVSVVGSPSGRTYGTTNIDVPARASPQYSITRILDLARAGALNGGDTDYALYLQNPAHQTGYQHVVFNSITRFFENASACNALLGQHQISESEALSLPNVHTSRLAEYPSQVLIHNYWDLPITYRVSVVDAATGTQIGTVDIPTAANASYSFPFSFFESRLGWTPSASQFHANLFFKEVSNGFPPINVGQSIRNQALGADINMSLVCAVNLATDISHSHDD